MHVSQVSQLGKRTAGYAWVILAIGIVAHISESIIRQGLPTLAPFFQPELGLSRAQVGLFMSALFAGGVLTGLPAGWLVDRWGTRLTLGLGLAVIGVLVIAASAMTSFAHGLLLLFLTGITHGVMNPATSRIVMVWFTARRRATAMGLKQTGIPLGGVVAAATLPAIAVAAGWRQALVAAGVAMLVVAGGVLLLCREMPQTAGGKAAKRPGLRVLRNRELWILSLTSVAMTGVQLCVTTYLALYLYETRGLSAVAAAGFLIVANVGGAIGRVVWGFMSDRLFAGRRKPVACIVAVSTGFSTAAAALAMPVLPLPAVGVLSFALGFTAMGWTTMVLTLMAEIAGREAVGAAVGLNSLMNNVGVLIGPPAFGALVDATGSYRLAWFGLTPVALAAALALGVWLRPR